MTPILLVEDDDRKREQLAAFLEQEFPEARVEMARSFRSARRALTVGHYSLVLLDMSLPTFDVGYRDNGLHEDGGTPQAFAGRDLLWHMDARGVSTPVIVVTGYEQIGTGDEAVPLETLDAELKRNHPNTYKGFVFYVPASSSWRHELFAMLKRLDKVSPDVPSED
jgi:CheY-like chemotaxis protein